jgi:hypothetical protein
MGRYYDGDIEGKFWFGVQPSNDGEFFGCVEQEPTDINYYTEDLEKVNQGVEECLKQLGENKEKLDKFFEKNEGYNDEMLDKAGFPQEKIKELLTWYARLDLGLKIQKCVKEQGYCSFNAEI